MSQPTQTCQACGAVENVNWFDRGFPPDVAKRRLAKRCTAAGHTSEPQYLVGFAVGSRAHGMTTPQPSIGDNDAV